MEDGSIWFLVEPGDVVGLSVILERLPGDPGVRASMGAAGRENVRDYSLDKVLSEMSEVYRCYLK